MLKKKKNQPPLKKTLKNKLGDASELRKELLAQIFAIFRGPAIKHWLAVTSCKMSVIKL